MANVIQVPLDLSDLERVHAFVTSAVVVDGLPPLRALVALHWPDKVKPPIEETH